MSVLEAYLGEYASGKSEVAVNRAVDLSRNEKVTLVDLDLVEPFYTLRPLKEKLESERLTLITTNKEDVFGLGERGGYLKPEMKSALRCKGTVIFDVGYGIKGAQTLNLVEGACQARNLRCFVVINIKRPLTSTVPLICEFVRQLGRVDALINNSHLGEKTDCDVVCKGALLVSEAAHILGLPVEATIALEEIARELGERDPCGNPVRPLLKRYMRDAYWT